VRYLRAHRVRLVHSFDFYSNLLAVPAARLARVRAVIASQRDLGDLKPRDQARAHETVLRLADYVLVNSAAAAAALKRRWPRADGRVVVIPNGVDIARFCPALRAPWDRGGRVTVGTLANLRPEKGLEDLISAAARVRVRYPRVRFAIWGEGPLHGELEFLIRTLGLEGLVELRGATAEPETALRALDIFVLPSTSESCSNALLEAMATGLAAVATEVGGNRSLVQDEATGLLVPAADPASMGAAILRLIEDPALAARLAAAARARVRAEFSTDRLAARIEALYTQALAGGRG
jgi:glycosyltransferase involved in cell wall biosynthesis